MTFYKEGGPSPLSWRRIIRLRILAYRFGEDDRRIDRMLKDYYGIELRKACLGLLERAVTVRGATGVAIKIPDRGRWGEIATAIHWGNGDAKGSRILEKTFR